MGLLILLVITGVSMVVTGFAVSSNIELENKVKELNSMIEIKNQALLNCINYLKSIKQ